LIFVERILSNRDFNSGLFQDFFLECDKSNMNIVYIHGHLFTISFLFFQFFNILLCLSALTLVYSQPIDFRNSRKDDGHWRNPFSFWQNKNFYTSPAPGKSDYLSYYVEEPDTITIKTKMGTLGSLLSTQYIFTT